MNGAGPRLAALLRAHLDVHASAVGPARLHLDVDVPTATAAAVAALVAGTDVEVVADDRATVTVGLHDLAGTPIRDRTLVHARAQAVVAHWLAATNLRLAGCRVAVLVPDADDLPGTGGTGGAGGTGGTSGTGADALLPEALPEVLLRVLRRSGARPVLVTGDPLTALTVHLDGGEVAVGAVPADAEVVVTCGPWSAVAGGVPDGALLVPVGDPLEPPAHATVTSERPGVRRVEVADGRTVRVLDPPGQAASVDPGLDAALLVLTAVARAGGGDGHLDVELERRLAAAWLADRGVEVGA